MSERVTQEMIDCWRVNYGLDKAPHDLHAFWGYEAPSGAVLALKAACDEIESMHKDAERYRWLRDTATTGRAVQLVQWMPGEMDAKIDAEMASRRIG